MVHYVTKIIYLRIQNILQSRGILRANLSPTSVNFVSRDPVAPTTTTNLVNLSFPNATSTKLGER